jgi:hypothetical protein
MRMAVVMALAFTVLGATPTWLKRAKVRPRQLPRRRSSTAFQWS